MEETYWGFTNKTFALRIDCFGLIKLNLQLQSRKRPRNGETLRLTEENYKVADCSSLRSLPEE